tara:strand:- start:581 stop:1303 length:723 start_codon:yes stop_codon:yes gene_type:complete
MNIVSLKSPSLAPPEFECDSGLSTKLNKYELTSYLNSHSTNLLIGKPKSGKTSLMLSFLSSPKILKKVFHNIYLFQPSHSRGSIKNDIFKKHPKDKLFDELTYENLFEVVERIKGADSKENHMILFDDMASALKNKETLNLFKQLIFNRRHLHTSIYFLNQTFFSVPKELRRCFSNIFVFKVGKNEMNNIFEEYIEDDDVKNLQNQISKRVFDKPFQYLFINLDNQKLYKCFDRIDFNTE